MFGTAAGIILTALALAIVLTGIVTFLLAGVC